VAVQVREEVEEGCQGTISFSDGSFFVGTFDSEQHWRRGKLFQSSKSEVGVEGVWLDGRLEGRAWQDSEYGGWTVEHYRKGLRHGYSVELSPLARIAATARRNPEDLYRVSLWVNGKTVGSGYKGLQGGCAIIGRTHQKTISDPQAVILMPGHRDALRGAVVDDTFVRGLTHRVEGVERQTEENGIPVPILSPPLSKEVMRRDRNMWTAPLLKEPWEHLRVEARDSGMADAGEGLFAKQLLQKDTLVALYNGVKEPPSLTQRWSDYRVKVNGDFDIDIPEDMRNVTSYCASLAHKANHSFAPNCRWGRVDHPRFGMISSLVAKQDILPGEEVTVNYRLPLQLAPLWFTECWRSWQNDSRMIRENTREQKEEEKKFMKEEKVMEGKEKNVMEEEEENVMEREEAKQEQRARNEEKKGEKSKSEKWERVEEKVNSGNQVMGKSVEEEEKER